MQLCTLYNFGSSTAVLRGGRQGRLEPTSRKIHSFHPGRRFLPFLFYRRYSLSTLETYHTDATFQALHFCKRDYH